MDERGKAQVGHPALVQALLDPGAYPSSFPGRIRAGLEEVAGGELAETRISYLFFTARHVHAVKNPWIQSPGNLASGEV